MEINQHNLGILRQAVETRFKNAFRALEKNLYGEFAMTIPMGTSQLDMPMLEQLVGMREWIDDRKVNNLTTQMLTIRPRKFENTYGIPADAIADDQYGVYVGMFEQMAAQAVNLRPDLIEELLVNAASAKWLDGANFFGSSRKYGKNTINNYTTNALTQANFKTAYGLMTSYMGHGNTPTATRRSVSFPATSSTAPRPAGRPFPLWTTRWSPLTARPFRTRRMDSASASRSRMPTSATNGSSSAKPSPTSPSATLNASVPTASCASTVRRTKTSSCATNTSSGARAALKPRSSCRISPTSATPLDCGR